MKPRANDSLHINFSSLKFSKVAVIMKEQIAKRVLKKFNCGKILFDPFEYKSTCRVLGLESETFCFEQSERTGMVTLPNENLRGCLEGRRFHLGGSPGAFAGSRETCWPC
jgi:hypothetical protein